MPQHRSIRLQRDVDGGNGILLRARWRCIAEQRQQAEANCSQDLCTSHIVPLGFPMKLQTEK
jgi:hypothetical protein